MQIITKKLNEIRPYEKNPRKNDEAVKYVAKSIQEFGFKVPIVIDKDGVIVCGHTRYKAATKLKMEDLYNYRPYHFSLCLQYCQGFLCKSCTNCLHFPC